MKKIILLSLLLIFVLGCSEKSFEKIPRSEIEHIQEEIQEPQIEDPEDNKASKKPIELEEIEVIEKKPTSSFDFGNIIETCNSLCNKDPDSYCKEKRILIIDGVEVEGTCRAFGRGSNIEGFSRCPGFCSDHGKSGTVCYIDSEPDKNCDGKA